MYGKQLSPLLLSLVSVFLDSSYEVEDDPIGGWQSRLGSYSPCMLAPALTLTLMKWCVTLQDEDRSPTLHKHR